MTATVQAYRCDRCGNKAYWIVWYAEDEADAATVCQQHLHMAGAYLEMKRTPGTFIKLRQVGR